MDKKIIFIDSEISLRNHKIDDLGAIKETGDIFHSTDIRSFVTFIQEGNFLCGHNIVHHDLKYLTEHIEVDSFTSIDTLYLSPLLFPKKPYHRLVKDDKLQSDELNNPLNDAIKARDLFYEEIEAFQGLPNILKRIYCALLYIQQVCPHGWKTLRMRCCIFLKLARLYWRADFLSHKTAWRSLV